MNISNKFQILSSNDIVDNISQASDNSLSDSFSMNKTLAGKHLTTDRKSTPMSGIDNRSYRTLAHGSNPQDTQVVHTSSQPRYKALDIQGVGSSPFVKNPDEHFHPFQGSTREAHLVQAPMPEESQQMAPIFDINGASVVHISENEKLPPHIYTNRHSCVDYNQFMQQTQIELGFIPLIDLKLYQGPERYWGVVLDLIQVHKMVISSGLPNFLSCHIPVQGPLRPEVWQSYLHDYLDQQLPDLIKFGFPLDFKRMYPLQSTWTIILQLMTM